MNADNRDPYATPPTPKSKSGPALRFAIVGALLVAGAVGAMNLPRGGELVPETEETTLADNSLDQPYAASPANEFVDPPAEAPASEPPAPRAAPQPEPEALPAPTTTSEPAGTLPPG